MLSVSDWSNLALSREWPKPASSRAGIGRRFLGQFVLLVFLFLAPKLAVGAARTWNGGGSNDNWSSGGFLGVGGNWSGAAAPAAGDSLAFGGNTRLTPNNDIAADTSFAGITFNSGAGAFVLGGNRITLGGDITNSSSASETINLAMILSLNRTFTTSAGDLIVGGILSGASGIIKAGTGILTLSGVNTYTGATTVNVGTLKEGANNVISDSSAVTVAAGATYDLNGHTETVGSLAGGGTVTTGVAGSVTLTAGGDNSSTSFSGVLQNGSGTMALTKSGTGTLTVTGANTYSGATMVNAGTLKIDNNNTTTARLANTTAITVNSGGTLLLAQTGVASNDRINNSATLTLNGGTFNTAGLAEHGAANNTAGIGALTLQATSIIDMASGTSIVAFADSHLSTWTGTLKIYNWTQGTDKLYFGNSATGLTSTQLAQIQFYSDAGVTLYGGPVTILSDGEVVPVPEPATYFACLLATGLLVYQVRRAPRRYGAVTRMNACARRLGAYLRREHRLRITS